MLVFDGAGRVMDSGAPIVAKLVPEITEDMGRDRMGFFEERAKDYALIAMEGGPAYEVPPGALRRLRGRLLGTSSRQCDILMVPHRLIFGRIAGWITCGAG